MDLVYVVCASSPCDDLELKYSIRSMVKHLHGFDKIFIVGHYPRFLKDAIHIPAEDPYRHNGARNIYEKILAACRHPDVSSSFICASDDYFLLKDFDANNLPFYHCGDLLHAVKNLGKDNYYKIHVENTYKILLDRGLPTMNFNIHFPIVYDKELYLRHMQQYNWEVPRGYISKSLYANTMLIPGEFMQDVKIHTPKTKPAIYRRIKDEAVFSTNEHSVNDNMKEVWQELYPESSVVEKDSSG